MYTYIHTGALMFRMNNNVKYKGKAEEILYYASTNFPAKIYICRYIDDNANGIPQWLSSGYNDKYIAINQIVLANSLLQFGCFENKVSGIYNSNTSSCVYDIYLIINIHNY